MAGSFELDKTPVCLIENKRGAICLVSINRAALDKGLSKGLTLADARARLPQLVAIEADPVADAAWLTRIADVCDRFTPMVALDAPDGLTLDITGCAHLFGGEQGLRDELLGWLSPRLSQIGTAIAGTPQAARALARFATETGTIVAPGQEAAAVASLPVAALEAGHDAIIALRRAGLKTIGALAGRPRAPLAARFGQAMVAQLARLMGEENTGITPRRPLPPCSVERRFAEPLTRMQDVLETLGGMACQAGQTLQERGEGGRCFEANLFRADGVLSRLMVETARPERDPKKVMGLFAERIDTLSTPLDPGYGYDLIRLSVMTTASFEAGQHNLDSHAVDEAGIGALVDRLTTRFGRQAIQQFVPVQSHLPERAVRAMPAGQAATAVWQPPLVDARPRRPVHMFERPEPIEAIAEIPDGPPFKFRWRRVHHEIARAEGPERIAPEWWRSETAGATRDYYCLEDIKGRRFWVFRQGLYECEAQHPRWFLHGLFA